MMQNEEQTFVEPNPELIKKNFGKISKSYDAANDAMTMGLLRVWRRKLVDWSKVQEGAKVLDVATGTGDLAILFKKKVGQSGHVVGLDLTPEMIELAKKKAERRKLDVDWMVGDSMELPFCNNEFDVATISYGIRNVQDPRKALAELARVVKPGGRVLVLETGLPRNRVWGSIYGGFFKNVLPQIGGAISGHIGPYRFLHRSSEAFPCGISFLDWMQGTGQFQKMDYCDFLGGASYLYRGVKKEQSLDC